MVRRRLAAARKYGTPEFFLWRNRYARFIQAKYFINDYIIKQPYKEIDYQQEFQQELTFVLPFAYWHHLNGTLKKTVASKYTKELYFFSENHEEKYEKRIWRLVKDSYEVPNMFHCRTVSYKKWARVPLKAHYKNEHFVFNKPLLIIANKYNNEWEKGAINYFSIPMLDRVLATFGEKYQIIYNRPGPDCIVMDNSEILELKETAFIRKYYPDVILAEDLYQAKKEIVNNYNHFQLMLYANCEHFMSVHGGTAALASYFGGTNIIYSKQGKEHFFKEFETVFPALSGARILHAKEEEDVFRYLKEFY